MQIRIILKSSSRIFSEKISEPFCCASSSWQVWKKSVDAEEHGFGTHKNIKSAVSF